jgi:hypothetical protein
MDQQQEQVLMDILQVELVEEITMLELLEAVV